MLSASNDIIVKPNEREPSGLSSSMGRETFDTDCSYATCTCPELMEGIVMLMAVMELSVLCTKLRQSVYLQIRSYVA